MAHAGSLIPGPSRPAELCCPVLCLGPQCWGKGRERDTYGRTMCAKWVSPVEEGDLCCVYKRLIKSLHSLCGQSEAGLGQAGRVAQVPCHRGLCSSAFQLCPVVRFWFYIINQQLNVLKSKCYRPEHHSLAETLQERPRPLLSSPLQGFQRDFSALHF